MDTLEQILAALEQIPPISVIQTSIYYNEATITLYQALPCSSDIYAVFIESNNQGGFDLYALQNTGSQYWIKIAYSKDAVEKSVYFTLPITNYLIEKREECLNTFLMSCRFDDLGNIPIRREKFFNPFISDQTIAGLLANYQF